MWAQTVGIINGGHKYLTAETFGFKINANGVGLKKKQLWSIQPFPLEGKQTNEELAEHEHVAIKSHLGCFLAVDQFGNVTCEAKELHKGARFAITICSISNPEGGGEQIFWAFKNLERGYFLGVMSDGMICCSAKAPQCRNELWLIHLVPARGATWFSLKSLGRKRAARTVVSPFNNDTGKSEQVQVDVMEAWGPETLFQFKYFEGGKYALLTSKCQFLSNEGCCIQVSATDDGFNEKSINPLKNGGSLLPPIHCLYTIEYHGGNVSFRDFQGNYLAVTGRSAILRSRSNAVSRDELFEFEPAPIQISFRADFNNKFVSVKQGYDLSANQSEISNEHETYSLEYDSLRESWFIRTKEGNYWAPGAASAVQCSSNDKKKAGTFKFEWNEDGTCSLLSSVNGESSSKYVCARKSGQLCLGAQEPIGFYMMFRNRTSFNLRAVNGSGFVGLKTQGGSKLDCNKTTPDSLLVHYVNSDMADDVTTTFNCCFFQMPVNNRFWNVVDGTTIVCEAKNSNCATQFQIELRSGCTIAIRTFESPAYLNLNKQGSLTLAQCSSSEATLWEF